MNMIRVWGGGIYESDFFYDLCDEMGLMVWQDFMFACSTYPAEGEWLENVREEAIDNIRRLRNHPCIVPQVRRKRMCRRLVQLGMEAADGAGQCRRGAAGG